MQREHVRKLQRRSSREPSLSESREENTAELGTDISGDEVSRISHPCHMTDEEFNALPYWSDVEDDPAYNVRYRLENRCKRCNKTLGWIRSSE